MGAREKSEEMKNRRTTVEAVAPDQEKPASDQVQIREPMATPGTTPHKPEAKLGREVQARIGQQLRSMYDDVVNQGVPQHITDLVRRLSEQD